MCFCTAIPRDHLSINVWAGFFLLWSLTFCNYCYSICLLLGVNYVFQTNWRYKTYNFLHARVFKWGEVLSEVKMSQMYLKIMGKNIFQKILNVVQSCGFQVNYASNGLRLIRRGWCICIIWQLLVSGIMSNMLAHRQHHPDEPVLSQKTLTAKQPRYVKADRATDIRSTVYCLWFFIKVKIWPMQ